jgi:hypothetical protein
MGYSAQVQQTPNQSGKGFQQSPTDNSQLQSPVQSTMNGQPTPMGKGGAVTNSATSGQPRVGQPNLYPNTVGMGDNTQQQPNQAQAKGKGA